MWRKAYFYHTKQFNQYKLRPIVEFVKVTMFKCRMLRVFPMFRHNLQMPSSGRILVGRFRQPHVVSAVGGVLCGAEQEQAAIQWETLATPSIRCDSSPKAEHFKLKCSRKNLRTRTVMCKKIITESFLCASC
jgi:hypothetical protein